MNSFLKIVMLAAIAAMTLNAPLAQAKGGGEVDERRAAQKAEREKARARNGQSNGPSLFDQIFGSGDKKTKPTKQ